MKQKYGFVYIWYDSGKTKREQNKLNFKYYIGSHWGTEDDGYICSSNWMRNSYKKRPQDFKRRILCRIYDKNRINLYEQEQKWMNYIKDEELGKKYYNLTNFAKLHWTADPESIKTIGEKISESHLANPDWGKWNKGLKHTEETKEKLRQANKIQFSDPENRKLNSEKSKELWQNPEYRQKQIEKHKGKRASEDTKNKMRQRIPWNKGKSPSEETKEKIRQSIINKIKK